jgi:hypothetical protein
VVNLLLLKTENHEEKLIRKSGTEKRDFRDRQLSQLSHEVVVIFVRADPKPDDQIAMLLCNRTIMIADSHRPDVADKRLELH